MDGDQSVLRWGGLAGILGGIVFILTIVALVASTFSTAPADPAGLVARYPDIRTTVALAETLDLVAVILWVVLFLALHRSLRAMSPAPALFGSVLGVLGLAMLLVGAITYVAFDPISNLYHAQGATPPAQATLVIAWQATQGVFNETDTVGFLLMSLGFVILGVGMLRVQAFGKTLGWLSIILAAIGVVGISVFSVTSPTFALFGILVFIVLPVVLGWKVYRLSKVP